MTDSSRLKDRVVIVTGGGGGIGKGACERIADEGGLVAVLDLRAELAEEVAAGINAKGGRAIALTCDVAVESGVKAAVAETVKTFGSLYGMVANAGTAGSGWIHETAIADWHAVLGVNLTGPFLCTKLPRPKPWLPIRRVGDPYAEYGATIAFLLSDDAGYITGSAIPVEGGYLAT